MIKFLDLKKVNACYEKEFQLEFQSFLRSGSYILGNQVSQFEKEFGEYCKTDYCIGVSNGLDAIKLIFEAFKILGKLSEGDEILVPANTYIASVLAISNCGLKPVLVDPSLDSFNIKANNLKKYVTNKTKAVLGVHLYGELYDAAELEEFCGLNNLLLIEDAAQAHGAVYTDGRKAGNLSNAAAFSFYPTKNLGALGDAGAITTNMDELAVLLRQLRDYGRESTYVNIYKGNNCRLDELQAAFLRVKLRALDQDNRYRRKLAEFYLNNINLNQLVLPKPKSYLSHVYHQFVIRSSRRDMLKSVLYNQGIETVIHYKIPIYKQIAYKELRGLKFPNTEVLHKEILSLPLNVGLDESEGQIIVEALNKFV